MTRRTLLLSGAAVVFVAGVVLAWMLSEREPAGSQPAAPSSTERGGSGELEEPPAAVVLADTGGLERDAITTDVRLENFDLDGAHWITGRALLPVGTPESEEAWVFAFEGAPTDAALLPTDVVSALEASATRRARRLVAPDGTFRVPLPADAASGTLCVVGRWVYSRSATPVRIDASEAVVLRPRLGARLTVHYLPPAGTTGVLAEVPVELQAWVPPTDDEPRARLSRRPALIDGRVVCDALPVESRYTLALLPEGCVPALLTWTDVELSAAADIEHSVQLLAGATVAGTVVDDVGRPVPGAWVQATPDVGRGRTRFFERSGASDAAGRFELVGVHPGRVSVSGSLAGFLPAELEPFDIADTERRDELSIVLSSGLAVRGRVTWPDGTPATGAAVSIRPTQRSGGRTVTPKSTVDITGGFELTGLPEGTYLLSARGERTTAGGAAVDWTAEVEDVAAGATGVLLVLRAPPGITGRVLDDTGAPVTGFDVHVRPSSRVPRELRRMRKGVQRTLATEDGSFHLPEVTAGAWLVTISSAEHVSIEHTPDIDVPLDEPLTVTLHRAARVEGVVLDPNGRPVPGAKVECGELAHEFFDLLDKEQRTQTDAAGAFEFTGLPPGRLNLVAESDDLARSAALEVELVPGASLAGIVLRLGLGGTLTGEVWEDGQPASETEVGMFSTRTGAGYEAETDARGHFRIDHVAPGTYQVLAEVDDDARGAERLAFATADVREGETTHVVVGRKDATAIRVSGRVTRAGQPVGGADLVVIGEGTALLASIESTEVGPDGTYEVHVPAPGSYVFFFEDERLDLYHDVPDESHVTIDLELPAGRISGTVRGPEGALVDVRVEIAREDPASTVTLLDGLGHEDTDTRGAYTFEGLAPGTYTVVAGDSRGTTLGRASRGGLVVGADAVLDGVDLVLAPGGSVEGTVLDADGRPAPGATVFVRDATGAAFEAFTERTTDARGRFRIPNLCAGRVTLFARTPSSASPPTPVDVAAGRVTDVELALVAAGAVHVACVDHEGTPVRASVSVVDELGFEHAALVGMADMAHLVEHGISSSAQRVGPIPPGKVRVTARTPDGRVAYREVDVPGAGEVEVRLAFEADH